jgi:quinol monooxygenase YgiN
MIQMSVALQVPSKSRHAVVTALTRQLGPTRQVPGCRSCRVLTDCEEPGEIMYIEEWSSQAELDVHLRSEEIRVLLETIEQASRPPELRFHTIAETRGMEVIAAAREGDCAG